VSGFPECVLCFENVGWLAGGLSGWLVGWLVSWQHES